MAFASRQARGRRWRNRWRCRASSTAVNSSSSRGLTIRWRTMTAIHRSGRCDKRDMKSRRGCRLEPFRSLPPHDHRRQQGNERKPLRSEGEGRQCATMSPDIRNAAPNCYLIARKRRFTVNLSGARPRHWKSEVLSIAVSSWRLRDLHRNLCQQWDHVQ